MKKRRLLLIVWLLTSILTLSGCWDTQEIGEIAITTGIAIEMTNDGRYRVIVQDVNPRAIASSSGTAPEFSKPYRNVISDGESIYDAINKLDLITPSQPFLAHTQVIIVSEEIAREKGVADILDYFCRNPQFRKDIWFVIGKGSLVDLMDVGGRITYVPTQKMFQIIESNQRNNFFVPIQTGKFITLIQNGSTEPYTAGVEIQTNTVPNETAQGILEGHVPEPPIEVILNSTAVFRQDKLAGWFDIKESRGLQWVRGEFESGKISFDNLEVPGKKIGAAVVSNRAKIKPQINNGEVSISINIELESFLQQVQGDINISDPEIIRSLESAQEKHVKEEVEAALKKAQQLSVDVFGFGDAIHRSYPEKWRAIKTDWPEVFPEVTVDVQVKSIIRHTSMTTNPIKPAQK